MVRLKSFCVALVALFLVSVPANAQFAGITPCAPNSLSVSNATANVGLSTCGPVVIVYNTTAQEAFYKLGTTSSTSATTTVTDSYSLPGNQFIVLQVQQGASMWLAAITASSTTTLRIVQGFAAP